MDNAKRGLQLVTGNRRTHNREHARHSQSALFGTINGITIDSCEIQEHSFGRVVLTTNEVELFNLLKKAQNVPITLSTKFECHISGTWNIAATRLENDSFIFVLEIPQLSNILPLAGFVDSQVLLRPGRFRVLDSSLENDIRDLSRHFTDLADFSQSITCTVSVESDKPTFKVAYDFSAKRKSLEILDLLVLDQRNISEFQPGKSITIDYRFMTVRYLFKTTIIEVDRDFNVISIVFPKHIIAITARRFDRWNTSLDIQCSAENNTVTTNCTLIEHSPAGGVIQFETLPNWVKQGSIITLHSKSPSPVNAIVRGVHPKTAHLSFPSSLSEPAALRDLFNLAVKPPLELRNSETWPIFKSIYEAVGYKPDKDISSKNWDNLTESAWDILDSKMPGNTIGARDKDHLAIAFSAIPLSDQTVYGHSLAMLKTLGAVAHFSEVALHNLAWVEFLESVQFYCGSARLKSGFATRLHTVFETHAAPETYRIFHALAVLPSNSHDQSPPCDYRCEESTLENLSLGEPYKTLVTKISKPHSLISDYHKIKTFKIIDPITNKCAAAAIAHNSPHYFTAANILRCTWLFILEEEADIQQIYLTVKNNDFMKDLEVDIFLPNPSKTPPKLQTESEQEEIFWYIFQKDEFGPILASINKAAWSVLRKYGPEAAEYIARMVS